VRRLLGSAAIVLLATGPAAASSPDRLPAGTLLVVAEKPHESGGLNYPSDVFVVDVGGHHLRNLTHNNASNGPAEWMPDGRRVVFQSHPSNTERGAAHIYVINSDGTGRRRLTSASGGALPDVSPDGRRLAFLIQRPKLWGGWSTPSEWGVYVMDPTGRNQRRMVEGHGAPPSGPSWSPDGRMIMFATGDARGCCVARNSLYVVRSDGTGLTRIASATTYGGASWSPRGQTLAVEHDNSLTIANLGRHLGRPVLRPVKKIANVSPWAYTWSSDGRSVIYQNDAGVWVADARGHAKRHRWALGELPLTWSPDGRWFAFASRRGIEVASATGSTRRFVTPKISACCPLEEIEWAPRRGAH
jgi:Tol biopolymer transport system component